MAEELSLTDEEIETTTVGRDDALATADVDTDDVDIDTDDADVDADDVGV